MANEYKYDKDHIVENYRKYIKTQRIRIHHDEHGELFTYQDVCDMVNVAKSAGNTSKTGESNCTIDSVMRFKFLHNKEIILEQKATPYYPRTGNFIWINERRYQVTAVHIDYSPNEMRFYCA